MVFLGGLVAVPATLCWGLCHPKNYSFLYDMWLRFSSQSKKMAKPGILARRAPTAFSNGAMILLKCS